jgi:hypothetical protein
MYYIYQKLAAEKQTFVQKWRFKKYPLQQGPFRPALE